MNHRERMVRAKYEAQGWRMLRGGSPDFLALRVDSGGNILEIKGVEVKPLNGHLTYEQSVYRMVFEKAGIPYAVEAVG